MSGIEHNADWVPVKQRLCCWGVGLQHESRWVVSFVAFILEKTGTGLLRCEQKNGVAGKK